MRLSLAAVMLGVLGALGGGWLIGRWALGLVLIMVSAGAVAWGLLRDDGAEPGAHEVPGQPRTFAQVMERARRAG